LSGAFGGLLARGLHEIGTRGGLAGWRWIFIVEGLVVRLSTVSEDSAKHKPDHYCGRLGLLHSAKQRR
jgi:hypothetical protein